MTRFVVVLAAAIAAAVITVAPGMSSTNDGRDLAGSFCNNVGHANPFSCMGMTWDGVAYGTLNRDDLNLRPGTYWLTVTDTSSRHDFSLRSCPDSTSPCDDSSGGSVLSITSDSEGSVASPVVTTVKVLLKHGTYRLFCAAGTDPNDHEAQGMYVDFEVGGVGQVG